ncbi:glycosyltransferase [Pseudonocardia aurantiaca]|uniref:Glycosyltransferase n=1 Tax=Pseudonocardia aurantiaca TaxID=75290 RepID=A0ABW4FP98_9PSEU
MRIAHIVAYLSERGEYGGPLSVATAQAAALAQRGNRVDLYTGWDGKAEARVPGVGVYARRAYRLGRSKSFATLFSPSLMACLIRSLHKYDVVHLHLSRDLLTFPAAILCRIMGKRVVIQTHGMVKPDKRILSRLSDIPMKAIFRNAAAHLYLTDAEADNLRELSPRQHNLMRVPNGLAERSEQAVWPQDDHPEVLYCGRIHPRKRVPEFVAMAERLLSGYVKARFTIVGPDGGDLENVRNQIAASPYRNAISYEGAVAPGSVASRLRKAQVCVLPSENEPFPMAVLEAMSVGLPVVVTESNGLASSLRKADPAFVTGHSAEELSLSVQEILSSADRWALAAMRSRDAVRRDFNIRAVCDLLETIYAEANL